MSWLPDYAGILIMAGGDLVLELAAKAWASVFGEPVPDCKRGSGFLGIQVCSVAIKALLRAQPVSPAFQQFCKLVNAL